MSMSMVLKSLMVLIMLATDSSTIIILNGGLQMVMLLETWLIKH